MKKQNWKRRLMIAAVVLLAAAGGLWMRMGRVVTQVNEAGYRKIPEHSAGVEFSVVTYNVQARPVFDDSQHKFQHISPVLNPYDLVGIQECFKDYRDLWEGTVHPVKIYDDRLKRPWKVCGSGLSVLGKFPFREAIAEHFRAVGEYQNWPASKGMILARFDIGGMPLDFYTTHMEAGRSDAGMWSRREQGEQLVEFVRKHSPPEHAVIMAGDFNMRPVHDDKDKLAGYTPGGALNFDAMTREQVFDAIRLELGVFSATLELHKAEYRGVDHVLYRPGTGMTLTPLIWQHDDPAFYDPAGAPLSDHSPLIIRFRLQRAAEK